MAGEAGHWECQICSKRIATPVMCDGCGAMVYCSTKHRSRHMSMGHGEECAPMKMQMARGPVCFLLAPLRPAPPFLSQGLACFPQAPLLPPPSLSSRGPVCFSWFPKALLHLFFHKDRNVVYWSPDALLHLFLKRTGMFLTGPLHISS
jgi:hypothetical protein